MDLLATAGLYAVIFVVLGLCLLLLLLYGVIRVAVARGMRDHYEWVEKNRPNGPNAPRRRATMGQYLGLSEAAAEPDAQHSPR